MSTKFRVLRVVFAAAAMWAMPADARTTPGAVYGPTAADYAASLDRMFQAGEHFRLAPGAARNYGEALRWYTLAAAAGDARSMAMLGWLHRSGHGTPQDLRLARHWYGKAYEEGYREGWLQYGLGWLLSHGRGGSPDVVEGHAFIKAAAATGHAPAMYHLAWNFEQGRGVTADFAEARRWYLKAAAAGSADAMTRLGHLHHKGLGVAQDFARARYWYERAANAGQADAMYNIGLMSESGEGNRRDVVVATRWFARAAATGHTEALVALGLLNRKYGDRVSAEAVRWLGVAANTAPRAPQNQDRGRRGA